MNKLIFAICLALLSFNANARCFEGNVDEEYLNCNVAEGVGAINKKSTTFILFSKGYLDGVSDALALLTIAQGKQTFGCDTGFSLQLIHDIMYDKVKNGEVRLNADYYISLGNTLAERFSKCLADNEAKQQKQ